MALAELLPLLTAGAVVIHFRRARGSYSLVWCVLHPSALTAKILMQPLAWQAQLSRLSVVVDELLGKLDVPTHIQCNGRFTCFLCPDCAVLPSMPAPFFGNTGGNDETDAPAKLKDHEDPQAST